METFYIPKPENDSRVEDIEGLLASLSMNFRTKGQFEVTEALCVKTDILALVPILQELAGPGQVADSLNGGNGHEKMRICPWCKKPFHPERKDQKFDTRSCAQLYAAEKKRALEFQVVETGKKYSAPDLKTALKNGEFVTGTKIDNFKTGDRFYVSLKSGDDKVEYELLEAEIDA